MACEYCDIIEGKKESAKIYEDSKIVAFLADQPAAIGHIVVAPKRHVPILEAVSDDELDQIFKIANNISVAAFESLKIEGTNIIVHNGVEAGQEAPHFSVNIISRKSGDGMVFEWVPKQLSEEEMATVELQLKEEMEKPEVPAEIPKEVAAEGEEKKEGEAKGEKEGEEKEESYLIKQLRRMP
ncbi:HIT family protein [Candidatus Woesearchaeota archaeon]|nr:HIT family protein [Candidatus Woesearchaeota archaeon]